MMIRRHKWKFLLLCLAAVIVLPGFIPWSKNVVLSNGGRAHIKPASFFRSFRPEAYCTIEYKPKLGEPGTIVLWQSLFDGPLLLIPSANTNVVLCLYDYDVDLRLFRIDTTKIFKPLSPSSELNHILFTCTWEIDDGTHDDWKEVLDYLRLASPDDFRRHLLPSSHRFSSSTSQDILHDLTYQGIKPE